MISLKTLRPLLEHTLAPPTIHMAALFTPPGCLVCYASSAPVLMPTPGTSLAVTGHSRDAAAHTVYQPRTTPSGARAFNKDDVHVLVGLGTEVWKEARADGEPAGLAECELGRIIVVPLYGEDLSPGANGQDHDRSTRSNSNSPAPHDSASQHTPDHASDAAQLAAGTARPPLDTFHDDKPSVNASSALHMEPLLLLALQGTADADWDLMQELAYPVCEQLAVPLAQYGANLLGLVPPLPPK